MLPILLLALAPLPARAARTWTGGVSQGHATATPQLLLLLNQTLSQNATHGALTSWWAGDSNDNLYLSFFVDGEAAPSVAGTLAELCGSPFGAPGGAVATFASAAFGKGANRLVPHRTNPFSSLPCHHVRGPRGRRKRGVAVGRVARKTTPWCCPATRRCQPPRGFSGRPCKAHLRRWSLLTSRACPRGARGSTLPPRRQARPRWTARSRVARSAWPRTACTQALTRFFSRAAFWRVGDAGLSGLKAISHPAPVRPRHTSGGVRLGVHVAGVFQTITFFSHSTSQDYLLSSGS
jgi:hypothetical protein